jgi:outer membrane receptor protein involved in Fe transport
MNDQLIRVSPLAAAIAAVLYPIQPALAQDQDETSEASGVLEEVLVTATFRETNLQSVPQSIMAFSSVEIQKANLQNLDDLVRALPSLGLVNSQPGRNELVYRGISSGTGEYYTDTQTAVYIDDSSVSLISQQVFPEFVDVERLESLPGPQATLFGSASQTGTLRYITHKPNMAGVSGSVFAEVGTTKGGDASYNVNGWVNVPVSESFAMRFVGYHKKDGGWIDNVPGETYRGPTESGPKFDTSNAAVVDKNQNKSKLTGGRISALWELSDGLSMSFAVISEDRNDDGTWNVDPSLDDFEIIRFYDEYRDDKWTNYAFTVDADLGFAAFKSVTSIFDRDIKYEWDNMAYEQYKDAYFGYYLGYTLYNSQYTFGTIFNDQNQKRFSQEFRWTSQSESKFQWLGGLYYEDVHDDWYYGASNDQLMETVMWPYAQYWAYYYNYYGYPVDYPMAPTNVGYSETLDRDIEQYSAFGEISYDFNEKWRVLGGMRWFQYDRYDYEKVQFPEGLPPWGTMDTDGVFIGEGKTSDVLFKGNITYQIDPDRMLYFLYSEGIRLGGFNSLRAVNTGIVPREYDPDKLHNYELGLKSTWMDNRLLLNATLFYMKWKDYQQNSSNIGGQWWLRGTFNAANAEQKGIELETTFVITDNLEVSLSGYWADPEWDETFWYPYQDPETEDPAIVKGTPLPNSPEYKGRASLFWSIPGLWGTESISVYYDISFEGKRYNNIDNARDQGETGKMPSWNASNLQIGANFPNEWSLNLVIRNLFDQKAMSWLDSGSNYISDYFGADWNRNIRSYNRPRTVSLQFRKFWD